MTGANDSTFIVQTPEQLRAIADPFRQLLLQELAEPATARALAERLKQPQTKLYHHLDQLLEAGLIKVVSEEKRRAVVERTFATSARRFAVSPGALSGGRKARASDRERLAREMIEGVLQDASMKKGGFRLMRVGARIPEAAFADFEQRLSELLRDLEEPDAPRSDIVLMVSVRK